MFHRFLKGIGLVIGILFAVAISCLTFLDREPYSTKEFYKVMDDRLDSLKAHLHFEKSNNETLLGWSSISIPIVNDQPLAGYGARKPKSFKIIHDSLYFKVFVIKKGQTKAAIITADLLIIHPELKRIVADKIPPNWDISELFFTATHTHSSIGSWAPGLVGELFAGDYDEKIVLKLSDVLIQALHDAEMNVRPGWTGYSKALVNDLIYNRITKEKGEVDPSFHLLSFATEKDTALITSYGAHATCLGKSNYQVTNDYPGYLTSHLREKSNNSLVGFMAGAVASMGPKTEGKNGWEKCEYMAAGLYEQVNFLSLIGIPYEKISSMSIFKIKLPLRDPYFKISKNIALRPFIFKRAFGAYRAEIAVLKLNDLLIIGMPGDYSGELALPLYKQAADLGMQLIITSFNGGYLGYIIKDEWYDLPKYESRTMSWYGPDMGSYINEISSRVIEIMHEN